MQDLITNLTQTYMVIIDAPPLLPVTDAGLLTAASDGALLVMHVGRTFKEQVKLSAKIVSRIDGKLLGAVMNMAPKRGIGAVVYGYGYGYGGYQRDYVYSYDSQDRRTAKSKPARAKARAK